MIYHIQSNFTGIAPETSDISHSLHECSTLNSGLFCGWPALGLSELNFVMLVPARLGFSKLMLEKL
jgi:hypothetical protein